MKYGRLFNYFVIAIALMVVVISCGDNNDSRSLLTEYDSGNPTIHLAPANEYQDQKIYATPSTMKYHLANCRDLTDDKQVLLMSEAIAQGYEPCERCFPVPKPPSPPMVYVIEGNTNYHLANCPKLDDTKKVIPKDTAIQQGYTPCFYCNSDPIAPPESHVYILPNDHEFYHIVGCPRLTEDKTLMPKALAVEKGYKPCPDCGVEKRIPGGIVYICPKTGTHYHGSGCTYSEVCSGNSMEAVTRWELSNMLTPEGKPYEPCSRCNGLPYNKEN